MKQKFRRSIYALVGLVLAAAGCGTDGTVQVPAPPDPVPSADAFGGHPDPSQAAPAAADRSGYDSDHQPPDALLTLVPQVGELFDAAQRAGAITGWEKFVGKANPDFTALDPQSKALAVGEALSDVGFHLVLVQADQTPDTTTVDRAVRALEAIDLPSTVRSNASDVLTRIQGGQLQGKAALDEVEKLVRNTLPDLRGQEAYKDVAHTALFGAFLRSTAVAAHGMLANKALAAENYDFLKQAAMADFFVAYFDQSAGPAYKDAAPVRKAIEATKQARAVMVKPTLTAEDVKSIATLFADYSG